MQAAITSSAAGGTAGLAETQRMIGEKIEASLILQAKAVTGGLGTTPFSGATGTLDHYGQKVLANRSRLSGRDALYVYKRAGI